MNIVLIGFMGSGKSTVAKSLSKLLDMSWIEMDDLIYQKTKSQNMHEVFAKGGELLLREIEITIAKEYASQKNLIVSTGGGVVLNKIVLDYFKKTGGTVIFLNAKFDQIVKQLAGDDTRPLFQDVTNAKTLYDFRLPLYATYADQIIETDKKSVEEITQEIAENLRKSYG